MDYRKKAALFRESAKEIRTCTATMNGEENRKGLMRLVDYYEQMATIYEDLAKLKTRDGHAVKADRQAFAPSRLPEPHHGSPSAPRRPPHVYGAFPASAHSSPARATHVPDGNWV